MSHVRNLLTLGCCAAALAGGAARALAADSTDDFLKAAEAKGYGEVCVDYLTALQASSKLPSELKETFDLKMSKALRISVREAFNRQEREARQAKSKEHLEKFVKEHPDHPEVAVAQSSFGDLALERGLQQMRLSRATKDKTVKAKHVTEARTAFDEARPRFADATTRYQKRFDDMQEQYEAQKDRLQGGRRKRAEMQLEDALYNLFEGRFKVGLSEFYFSQTFEDLKEKTDKARVAALTKAAAEFDSIFQENRESLIGLTAHAWHGRCADELGNYQEAADIYEEVLSNVPDNLTVETGLEGMFAQVFYFRALLEIKKGNVKEFVATASGWRKTYRNWRKEDGYQGISLEYVKALHKDAEKAPDDLKKKMMAEISTVLKEMTLTPGEHQDDAYIFMREIKKISGDTEAGSVAEAIALGDDAANEGKFDEAEKKYAEALELATNSKKENEKKRIPEINARFEQSRYRRAAALYAEGKMTDVLDLCGKLARKKDSPAAPAAASLAVSAALTLYAQAPDPEAKEKALDRLNKISEYLIKSWPDKAEADDARIAMGQAKLVQGKPDDAIAVFEEVNKRSERYGVGLYLAGQTHWRLYLGEKARDPAGAAKRSEIAQTRLKESLDIMRAQAEAAKKTDPPGTPPRFLPDAELLLAEVYVDAGNSTDAITLIEPQVAAIVAAKPTAVDNTMLRTFLSAVRAYMGANNLPKASETALTLVELGADEPQINKVLVGFAKMCFLEWKTADAAVIELKDSNDATAKEAADTKLKGVTDMLGKLLEKLVARTKLDVPDEMFMARTAMGIKRSDIGEPILKRLIEKADAQDPKAPVIPLAAIPGLRAPLIAIVREKGDFAEALKQVDALIAVNPNALDFLMEKGRILQTWAEKDKTKFPEAVAHWTDLRTKLQGARTKPSEYYEVIYNTALCLVLEGEQAKDTKKSIEAAKLLNALLFTSPKLNGPDTVARYKDLLKRADPESYKKRIAAEKLKEKELKDKARAEAKAKATAAK